jgi:UPF0755 protein
MAKRDSRGKKILVLFIVLLLVVAMCLIAGITATIPARTAQLFGPPVSDLSTVKLYQQSLALLLSKNDLFEIGIENNAEILFPIEQGDSLDKILTGLTQLGLIRHTSEFRAYLIYSGIDTNIQPGEYLFSPGLSELEVAQILGTPAAPVTTVSILAGWRAEEIAQTFPGLGLELDPDQFLQVVKEENKEGYLFPGNYQVSREISAISLVNLLYERFITQITPEMEARISEQGLSLDEAVILASIIEREAVVEEEMPQIASVFLNRLRGDLNLSADPTVQYALGYNETQGVWWTNPLSLDDLKLPSSYNTYENPGLPPAPICNPGLKALQAVANPADTSFLFFRAACDGSGLHVFAETFEEHLENACE